MVSYSWLVGYIILTLASLVSLIGMRYVWGARKS